MSQTLTPELLRERVVALFGKVMEEHGPIDEVIFETVTCDGCGLVLHMLRDGYPVGWTTDGDLEHGWFDLCRSCSQ